MNAGDIRAEIFRKVRLTDWAVHGSSPEGSVTQLMNMLELAIRHDERERYLGLEIAARWIDKEHVYSSTASFAVLGEMLGELDRAALSGNGVAKRE